MAIGLEARVERAVDVWVGAVTRRPRAMLAAVLGLTVVAGTWAAARLGVDSDNIRMLAEHLPVRQRHDAFAREFPNLTNALIVVVDGETPEQARAAAAALAERLAARREFREVHRPAGGRFFERHGLLYRTPAELDLLAERIAAWQPFLIALEREPTLANLTRMLRVGLERVDPAAADGAAWSGVLDRVSDATVSVYTEGPVSVSWESLLLRGSALETEAREVIVAEPVLDFASVLPARDALAAIRSEARALAAPGVRVRVTGNPALNHEEMLSLARDVGLSGVASLAAIALLLWLAFRSARLVAAALATLGVGLVWTTAAAAATVGHLNLVSITFAVLYVGLGIDFAIHLGMHYAEQHRRGVPVEAALRTAAGQVGGSLVLCALTTSIGFYAFLPTDYRGVAELGLIAGSGMLVILFQTLTLLPALLAAGLAPPAGAPWPAELRLPTGWAGPLARHPAAVRRLALAAALLGLLALPALRFDPNVVDMRNPNTESVQAFQDLVAAGGNTTPWYADVLADDREHAAALAARLRAVPGVARAITLADYVPDAQDEKRAILADLALLLDPAAGAPGLDAPPPTPAEQVAALAALHEALAADWLERDRSALGASARRLRDVLADFLARVRRDADPAPELARLEALLLGHLPRQLDRLRAALAPPPIALGDLPAALRQRMESASGRARVQVFPAEDLRRPGALERFADAVQSVAPAATGMAVDLVEFGRVISRSLVEALAAAFAAVALLVLALWRRPGDAAVALAPLVLAGILTAAVMVGLGIAFNFANVIVLPLLLGIGVDSGIHLVHRVRQGDALAEGLLETTTARAVFFSFATTLVSFGNLAFSSHRGIASLGLLLVLGLAIAMACNLAVLPALLARRPTAPS